MICRCASCLTLEMPRPIVSCSAGHAPLRSAGWPGCGRDRVAGARTAGSDRGNRMAIDVHLSTGVPGLDRLLRGLIAGDNLVWQVDAIEHFAPFVPPYCRHALARGKRIVYFRFADHPPLVPEELPTTVCQLDTSRGFEQLITEIHRVLGESGREACFVFDCLSMLADAWLSDRMLGNFFRLTCPYVLDLESLAYFPAAAQSPFVSRASRRSATRRRSSWTCIGIARSCTCIRSRWSTGIRPRCTCCTGGRGTTSCRWSRVRRRPRSSRPSPGPDWTRCGCGKALEPQPGAGRAAVGGNPGGHAAGGGSRASAWTISCR